MDDWLLPAWETIPVVSRVAAALPCQVRASGPEPNLFLPHVLSAFTIAGLTSSHSQAHGNFFVSMLSSTTSAENERQRSPVGRWALSSI
jgi:hypothetical protein